MVIESTSEPLPSRKAIEERLHDIRDRLWHVQGICGLASQAGEAESEGAEGFAYDIWNSMASVKRELGEITAALDPLELLEPREAAAEAQS